MTTIVALIEDYTAQEIANIAWSFAVFDVAAPELFVHGRFMTILLGKEMDFRVSELSQLHQFFL